MILYALALREGEPVACAYGVARNGDTVSTGLLFARSQIEEEALDFEDPATKEVIRLRLPENGVKLKADAYFIGVDLGVIE